MMRKYYKVIVLVIFSFFLFASSSYAVNPVILYGMSGGDSSTCDTSNIVFWWRCETTTLDATYDYSAASGTPTVNSIDVSTDAVKYGSKGLDVADASSYLYYTSPSATLDDSFRMGFWLWVNTWPAGDSIIYLTADGNNYFKLRFAGAGTGELFLYWKDSGNDRDSAYTSGAAIGTGTWYFIEIAVTTNYIKIYVDSVEKASDTSTLASFASPPLELWFGSTYAISGDWYMDNVIISTDYTDDLFTYCKDELEWPE